jgi:hypothetical protein
MKDLAASAVLGLTAVPTAARTGGSVTPQRDRRHVGAVSPPVAGRRAKGARLVLAVVFALAAGLAVPLSVRLAPHAPPAHELR